MLTTTTATNGSWVASGSHKFIPLAPNPMPWPNSNTITWPNTTAPNGYWPTNTNIEPAMSPKQEEMITDLFALMTKIKTMGADYLKLLDDELFPMIKTVLMALPKEPDSEGHNSVFSNTIFTSRSDPSSATSSTDWGSLAVGSSYQ